MSTLFNGELIVRQPEQGYRFSIDAVLLAGLTRVKLNDRCIDLGTGCGVIPLICTHRGLGRAWTGLELQEELAALASANVRENGFEGRVRILSGDLRRIRDLLPPQSFDLALSNPPYRRTGTGRVAPDPQRALARHEFTASVPEVVEAARWLLPFGGRLAIIYPAERLPTLMAALHAGSFQPKRMTLIHSREGEPARLVHVEAVHGGGEELRVEPPFYIYAEDGSYTREMQRLYEP